MTTIELKAEIDKELEKLSEKTLEDVLEYVKNRQFSERLENHFDIFVAENENLLRRLAQ